MKKEWATGRKSALAGLHIVFVLTFVYLTILCFMPTSVHASKAKLSKTKIEMYVGTDSKITVSHAGKTELKWKTSNKRIVTVKKISAESVRLQAGGKAGKAVISVKVAGKTLKCHVTVKKKSLSSGNRSTENKGPKLVIGSYIFHEGGTYSKANVSINAGETKDLKLINSVRGIQHTFYLIANNKGITSGVSITSSNEKVLSYYDMNRNWAYFYSLEDGTTTLTIRYNDTNSNKNYTYKCRVTIKDDNQAFYDGKREEIYRSLGINSNMPRQQVCLLLACWACDHAYYDPDVKVSSDNSHVGINSTYKDFFHTGKLQCGGYADLYMFLCAGLSIPCKQVVWDSRDHVWNQVQIDGQWYNVDVTWMDSSTDGKYNMQYFLTSDACMNQFSVQKKHKNSHGNECNSTRFDGCCQEQLLLQNQWLKKEYTSIYASSSHLSPWFTGTWINY